MIKNTSIGSRLFDVLNYILLACITLTFILPFAYMLAISFSDPYAVATYKVGLWPKGFNLEAYKGVLDSPDLMGAYWNSIRFTVLGTFFVLVIASLTAYPLSLSRFRFRKQLTVFFTITMFFNGGLIPTFLLMKQIRFIDTIWAITVPVAFGFWNIVIMRTNFQSIPGELYESAFIDGANDWQILLRIVLPLSKAILATIALFASVGLWNSYFPPLMYLNSQDMQPLTIILRRILVAYEIFSETDARSDVTDPLFFTGKVAAMRMATIFVTIGPIVLVYPFVQKYFVQGILVGSIKG